jgi:hypothetical protein
MASDVPYDAVRAHIEANWPHSPIAFENEEFHRPSPPAHWLSFEMSGDLYSQQSIGAGEQSENRWDEEGTIWGHVYAPKNAGTSYQRKLCRWFADLFRGQTLLNGNLEFLDAHLGLGEPGDEKGVYWRISVTVDWRWVDA